MNWLVDFAASAGMSSFIGLAGGLAQKFVDLRAKRLEYTHDVRMRKYDIDEASLEMSHQLALADKQIDIAETEGQILVESKEVDAFVESQKGAGKNSWLTWIRASITLYILIACSALSVIVWIKVGGLSSFDPSDLKSLLKSIIDDLFYLMILCVSWWFAARDGNLRFKR